MYFEKEMAVMRFRDWGSRQRICVGALIHFLFTGCGNTPSPSQSPPPFDLTGMPLSEELAPLILAARERMASPQRDNPVRRDLSRQIQLQTNITRPESQKEAGDELYSLWRADPRNLLWCFLP